MGTSTVDQIYLLVNVQKTIVLISSSMHTCMWEHCGQIIPFIYEQAVVFCFGIFSVNFKALHFI